MKLNLRPALSADYPSALDLYVQTIKPLATAWIEWVDHEQEAQFASLWCPADTQVITLKGEDIGWVKFRCRGDELFFKKLYTI